MIPRTDSSDFAIRPLCIQVSDLDILVEFDPENKVKRVFFIRPFKLTHQVTHSNKQS